MAHFRPTPAAAAILSAHYPLTTHSDFGFGS
jgi:hypothetical protein